MRLPRAVPEPESHIPRDTGTGMSNKLHLLLCLQSEDHNEPCQRGRVSEHPSQEKGGGQGCLAGSDTCESARGRRRDRYPRFERCAVPGAAGLVRRDCTASALSVVYTLHANVLAPTVQSVLQVNAARLPSLAHRLWQGRQLYQGRLREAVQGAWPQFCGHCWCAERKAGCLS